MIFHLTMLDPTHKKTYALNWLEMSINHKKLMVHYGHAPLIAAVDTNSEITLGLSTGAQESLVVRGGIMIIERTKATLIQE